MKIPEQAFRFKDSGGWRAWLKAHHESENHAWVEIRRANSSSPGILLDEAVEEALCYGWIDSLMKPVDKERYILRFSPRKPGSIWSVSNIKRIEKLISEGRMTEAGMVRVREAIESGELDAARKREDTSILPEDLKKALDTNPEAYTRFENLSPSQKRQYIYWITSAKSSKTRHSRIEKTIGALLAAGQKSSG